MKKFGANRILGVLIIVASFYGAWLWNRHDLDQFSPKKMNRLSEEKSPYLLQHKDNPVHWYAWGEDALAAAKKGNKLIFVSVGYSTCHWCHVMEHDSFEKPEVAKVLNDSFISIKIDREERPDLDAVFMTAVQQITGRGGWPLTIFLTPDGKPFFGGTFFWKDQFISLLQNLDGIWQKEPQKILESSQQLVSHLQELSKVPEAGQWTPQILTDAFTAFDHSFDENWGGWGAAPKFPRSIDIMYLLREYQRSGNPRALAMAEKTLEKMARGGMYDHLKGGFHRYSTDSRWLVPHFEKMLYDNALLALAYLEAFQLTHKSLYGAVARETLDYVLSDMTGPKGGFYSAEDADSEGEEGKYYVWTQSELKQILDLEEQDLFLNVYGVNEAGNFEGKNILTLAPDVEWEINYNPVMKRAKKKLLEIRSKRIPPLKDDKVLTDWNGLMIAAMARGARVLNDERYLKAAQKSVSFIQTELWNGKELKHRYRDGEARFTGNAEDFSFLIWGLIEVYQADLNPNHLKWAIELQAQQDQIFWDGDGYVLSREPDVLIPQKEFYDGATPSSNSVSAWNLLHLYSFTQQSEYREKALKLLGSVAPLVARHAPAYTMSLLTQDYLAGPSQELAVIYDAKSSLLQDVKAELKGRYLPRLVFAAKELDAETAIPLLQSRNAPGVYLCENHVCQAPMTDLEQIKKALTNLEKRNEK